MPNSWIERIFEVMAGRYGARFMDSLDGVPIEISKREWGRSLANIKPEQIAFGLERLDQLERPQYVPSAPEFAAHCRRQVVPQSHRLMLPPPKRTQEDRDAGRARFEQMKRELGWAQK